jgi:hypothetical protein
MKREESPISTITVSTNDERYIWARFYWSKNSGIHGHQIITEFNVNDKFETTKTNGSGFNKEAAAFESFILRVFPNIDRKDFENIGGGSMQDIIWWKLGQRSSRDVEMTIEELKSLVTK